MRETVLRMIVPVVLGLLAVACGGAGPNEPENGGAAEETVLREVAVDGGTERVVGLGTFRVEARPGETVLIRNANQGLVEPIDADLEDRDDGHGHTGESTVTHAFVAAPSDALPPLFMSSPSGAGPNAGVWGPCRGGDPANARGTCPVVPIDGPRTWNGSDYWSTGSMLPGETREIPLDPDAPVGSHTLICAIHPDLAVEVVVVEEEPAPVEPLAAPTPPGGDESPDPGSSAVAVGPQIGSVQLNEFVPATVEAAVGDTVTWRNDKRTPHDVVLGVDVIPSLTHFTPPEALAIHPDGAWDGSGEIRSGWLTTDPAGPAGSAYAVTFGEPGTYPYYCRFHPTMTGTVVVA